MTHLLGPMVVLGAIAVIVYLVLRQPDQTATAGPGPEHRPDGRRTAPGALSHAEPVDEGGAASDDTGGVQALVPGVAGVPALPGAPALPRARAPGALPAADRYQMSPWDRIRSGVVLVVLLALVGAVLAIGVAGLAMAVTLAVRNALA